MRLTLLVGFVGMLFASCGGDVKPPEVTINNKLSEELPVKDQVNESYYQIPSPDEMFGFIKESGLEYNMELTNSTQNCKHYVSPQQQALILGIYSADLAYSTAYEESNEAIKYFGTIKKLAEDVGIAGAFPKELIQKIQDNLNSPETLIASANDSYFSIVDYLEQNEQGDKLGVVAGAGWLETVYIVVNTTDFTKDKMSVDRLIAQKLVLENLLDYLEQYSDQQQVSDLMIELKELEDVFANVSESESETEVSFKKKEDGKIVLGGGTSMEITEVHFNAIRDKVNEIRNNIVSVEV